MVLATLLHGMDYKIAIAHCNFQLRGADSDADEEFVRAFAASRNLPFFTVRFDTLAFKKEKQLSTQMATRELRYQWLEEIRKNNGSKQSTSSIAPSHFDTMRSLRPGSGS